MKLRRGSPRRVRPLCHVLISMTALISLTACSTADAPSADPSVAAPAAASPSVTCEELNPIVADALFSNSSTGAPRVPGDLGPVTAVLSPEKGQDGKDVYVIAARIGDKTALLAHAVPPGTGVRGPGLFAALDPFSEEATGFFQSKSLAQGAAAGVEAAISCL